MSANASKLIRELVHDIEQTLETTKQLKKQQEPHEQSSTAEVEVNNDNNNNSYRLSISVFAMPADTNSQQSIFGGWLLSQMDLAALVECKMQSPGRYVTIVLDQMKFLKPVQVGDLVQIYTNVQHIGTTSIRIGVRSEVNRLDGNPPFVVTQGTMTFVKTNEQGQPIPIVVLNPKSQ